MTFNRCLEHVKVYEAGKPIELVMRDYGIAEESVVKLASNENPFGASPKVIEAVRQRASQMALYPDDSMYELKGKLAQKFGVETNEIVIGAGSDQVIDFAIKAKCEADSKILTSKITFAMYDVYAAHIGVQVIKTEPVLHELEAFLAAYREHRPDLVFLCLPNNPLGECLDRAEVEQFLKAVDPETLVVLDGAYQEYAAYKDAAKALNPKELIQHYPNVLYLGTFSKAYGLGGMRVGYGIGDAQIIQNLYKLRPPFNITTLSLVAASAALDDEEYVKGCIADCFSEMQRYEAYAEKIGISVIPSYTNFITYKTEAIDSTYFAQWLLERGMIVRNLASYGLNAIRVTIGKSAQNDRFFELADEYMQTTQTMKK